MTFISFRRVLNRVYFRLTTVRESQPFIQPRITHPFNVSQRFGVVSVFVYKLAQTRVRGFFTFHLSCSGWDTLFFSYTYWFTFHISYSSSSAAFSFTHPPPCGSFPPKYVFFPLGFGTYGGFDAPTRVFSSFSLFLPYLCICIVPFCSFCIFFFFITHLYSYRTLTCICITAAVARNSISGGVSGGVAGFRTPPFFG